MHTDTIQHLNNNVRQQRMQWNCYAKAKEAMTSQVMQDKCVIWVYIARFQGYHSVNSFTRLETFLL